MNDKVAIFVTSHYQTLQQEINDFLATISVKTVVNIQYAITADEGAVGYSALVHYKE
ncbi:MAG TPA: sporulation protein Cse60 [Dehalococcoidia bacterium]|nr:sporulation protein Cse60 [Dehalococcoidia bacterium]